ncbi:MAG: LysM peptidoglycan-binding domain-containing protein [Pseudomonadota bacterium]
MQRSIAARIAAAPLAAVPLAGALARPLAGTLTLTLAGALTAAGLALGLSATPASAQRLSCDTEYTVRRGDTLSDIAFRTYGQATPRFYQRIFSANPGKLRSVDIIPVGVGLFLPCEGGSAQQVPGGGQSASTGTQAPQVPAGPSGPATASVRIVTGDDYPPYVGSALRYGGFSTELVRRAVIAAPAGLDHELDVIDDWSAMLDPLLAKGLYDFTFPWFKPDCSK